MMEDKFYIGNFIVDIFIAMEDFKRIYAKYPKSVTVDSRHYNLIKNDTYEGWVNTTTMTLMNNVVILEETDVKGSFMRMKS